MATTLRTVLFVLLFAFITQIQFNLDADKTATRQLKNALEVAVHDAGLAVDPISLSEGKIVFQNGEQLSTGRILDDTALDNLENSLESNLNLNSSGGIVYTPHENSFFNQDVFLYVDFVDDRVTRMYPYSYSNPTFEILETINGPSVVAVLITESPRWFKGGTTYVRQAAVYEYKK